MQRHRQKKNSRHYPKITKSSIFGRLSTGDGLACLGVAVSVAALVLGLLQWNSDNLDQQIKNHQDEIQSLTQISVEREISARQRESDERADLRMHEAARLADERSVKSSDLASQAEDKRASIAVALSILQQSPPKTAQGKLSPFDESQQMMRRWAINMLNRCTPDNPIPQDKVETMILGIPLWHLLVPLEKSPTNTNDDQWGEWGGDTNYSFEYIPTYEYEYKYIPIYEDYYTPD